MISIISSIQATQINNTQYSMITHEYNAVALSI